jgi:hypothetical protein
VVNNCDGTSTVTASNFTGTLAWSDGGSGNPRSVSTTTALTVTQTINGCTSDASNSVTPAPKSKPGAPTLQVVNNCDGTSTVTASNFTGTLAWSDGGSGNPRSVSTTTALTVTQTINGCTSDASNSVTPAPATAPSTPYIKIITSPSCSSSTGTLRVKVSESEDYSSDFEFSNGGTYQDSPEFTFVAGGGYDITVRRKNTTCTATASCAGEVQQPLNKQVITTTQQKLKTTTDSDKLLESQTHVLAYPNPYNDKVRFQVTSLEAGRGSLEVYSLLGQKVKTVYQGQINAGSQSFEMSVPLKQRSDLIYVLKIGDKKISGKLLQMNK